MDLQCMGLFSEAIYGPAVYKYVLRGSILTCSIWAIYAPSVYGYGFRGNIWTCCEWVRLRGSMWTCNVWVCTKGQYMDLQCTGMN